MTVNVFSWYGQIEYEEEEHWGSTIPKGCVNKR